jgi:hypothetical protein
MDYTFGIEGETYDVYNLLSIDFEKKRLYIHIHIYIYMHIERDRQTQKQI